MDWLDLLVVQGTLSSLLQNHSLKASIQKCSVFSVQFSHPYMTLGKTMTLIIWTFVRKMISMLFNTLSSFFIALIPKSKDIIVLWLQLLSTVILGPEKIKSVTVSFVSPSICHEVVGLDIMVFIFWMLSFKPAFSLSFFTFIKKLFGSCALSTLEWCHLHIWDYWYFSWQSWFQLMPHPAQHFAWYTLHIG